MKQHPMITQLLDDIEKFKTKNDLTATRFGQLAVGDGNFTRAIRQGRTPSLGTIERVRQFMKDYRRKAA